MTASLSTRPTRNQPPTYTPSPGIYGNIRFPTIKTTFVGLLYGFDKCRIALDINEVIYLFVCGQTISNKTTPFKER